MHRYSFFYIHISRNIGSRWYRLRYNSRIYVGITSCNAALGSLISGLDPRGRKTIRYEQRGVAICINKLSDGGKLPCSRISQAQFYGETRDIASRFWTNSNSFSFSLSEKFGSHPVKGKRVFRFSFGENTFIASTAKSNKSRDTVRGKQREGTIVAAFLSSFTGFSKFSSRSPLLPLRDTHL